MTVDTPCPQCGTVFTVRRELLGKRTKCTRCGAAFTIAEAAAPMPSPPPPPATNYFPEIATPPPTIPPIPQITPEPAPRATRRPSQPGEFFGFKPDASQPRFPALRMVARAYEVLAVVMLLFAVIVLAMFVITVVRNPEALLGALLGTGLTFFWATVVAMTLLAFAQAIRLALQIEQNTRQTHQACRQLADHLCAIETES